MYMKVRMYVGRLVRMDVGGYVCLYVCMYVYYVCR